MRAVWLVLVVACSGTTTPAPIKKPPPENCPATLEVARSAALRCAAESTLSCVYDTTVCTCTFPAPPCGGDDKGHPAVPPHKVLICPTVPQEPPEGCPSVWQPKSAEGDEPACAEDGKHCTYDAERCCERHADCRDGRWEFASSCSS